MTAVLSAAVTTVVVILLTGVAVLVIGVVAAWITYQCLEALHRRLDRSIDHGARWYIHRHTMKRKVHR